METVNFQCGHCGNLMAVGTEHLGQQVRCPHCQQVVVAPAPPAAPGVGGAPAPAASGETAFPPTVAHDHEDIFAPPPPTEDLFDAPRLPKLEVPASGPPAPNGPPPEPGLPQPGTLAYAPEADDATLPFAPGPALPPGEATLPVTPASPGPNWMDATVADAGGAVVEAAPDAGGTAALPGPPPAGEDLSAAIPRPVRRASGGGGWFIPLVFFPLVLYAVLATFTAAWFWRELNKPHDSPFDALPDVDGDNPGVKKVKTGLRLNYDRKLTTDPLPAHLRVALGQTLRVGDLEVTPERVERRRVAVVVEGFKGEPCPGDSLVLHLRLRNRAADYEFCPLDDFFDRCWRPPAGLPPLTLLEAGTHRFYGGPAHWRPRGGRQPGESVEGRPSRGGPPLAPGAEESSFVCTDGGDPEAVRTLFGEDLEGQRRQGPYQGPLLWRVQVRRGLYDWKGRRLPATAVIGVEFSTEQVAPGRPV